MRRATTSLLLVIGLLSLASFSTQKFVNNFSLRAENSTEPVEPQTNQGYQDHKNGSTVPNDDPYNIALNVIEGFIFGFLGDDASEIRQCTLEAENITAQFWDAINTFSKANLFSLIPVMVEGI